MKDSNVRSAKKLKCVVSAAGGGWAEKLRVAERKGTVFGGCIFIIFEAVCTNAKKHMAYRKKYKPCI